MKELQYPVRPGRYRHFKGNEYQVLGVARHSETEEEMVVYRISEMTTTIRKNTTAFA